MFTFDWSIRISVCPFPINLKIPSMHIDPDMMYMGTIRIGTMQIVYKPQGVGEYVMDP